MIASSPWFLQKHAPATRDDQRSRSQFISLVIGRWVPIKLWPKLHVMLKSTPFVTGRRVTDETGKKNGGCPWAAWAAAEGRRLDQWIGCVLYRLNAGSLTAIPSATHLSDNHLLPPIYQLKGVTKLKSIPSLSQPSPWKEIGYSVVIRTRLIIFRFFGITQHLNYCASFSPSKFQLFEDSWIYCVFIKN